MAPLSSVITVTIMIAIVIIVFSTIRDRYVDRSLPILSTTALPQGVSRIVSYRIVSYRIASYSSLMSVYLQFP